MNKNLKTSFLAAAHVSEPISFKPGWCSGPADIPQLMVEELVDGTTVETVSGLKSSRSQEDEEELPLCSHRKRSCYQHVPFHSIQFNFLLFKMPIHNKVLPFTGSKREIAPGQSSTLRTLARKKFPLTGKNLEQNQTQ